MGGVEGAILKGGLPRLPTGLADGFDFRMKRDIRVLACPFDAFSEDLVAPNDACPARAFTPVAGEAGQFQAAGHVVFVWVHRGRYRRVARARRSIRANPRPSVGTRWQKITAIPAASQRRKKSKSLRA